jgi:CheY-like chemotaxis protein
MFKSKKKTILVVEDEGSLADAIKIKLEFSGFSVATARSADDAMFVLEEKGKDIAAIWLDHFLLGDEYGLDFVAKLKKDDSQWKDIPVIVVTNTESIANERAYLELGVKKYYTKANNRLDEIIKELKEILK